MSWQSYVDDQLIGTGAVAQGAVIGLDGNIRAVSPGLNLSQSEAWALTQLFANPAQVFATGVTVGGIQYVGIKADDRSIYGKKGASGIGIGKTNEALVVGVYNDSQQPDNAYSTVERLTDYLLDNGQ